MKINGHAFTFGADPEVFVGTDGKPASAIGIVGGSKYKPKPVKGGAVQEDNVLAEFNIRPSSNESTFVRSIQGVLTVLDAMLPGGMAIIPQLCSHEYTIEELRSFGPDAFIFGCDPDFNAYTGEQNIPPEASSTLRTAGGHIHVGYDDPNEGSAQQIVRAMDLFLGVPSVLIDKDTRRRGMYGGAGCLRYKPYGVEYRTLSNFWIFSEERIRWAFRQTVAAIDAATRGAARDPATTFTIPTADIIHCINTSDRQMAQRIVQQLDIPLVQ